MDFDDGVNHGNPAAASTAVCVHAGLNSISKSLNPSGGQSLQRNAAGNEDGTDLVTFAENEDEELLMVPFCCPSNKRRRRNSTDSTGLVDHSDSICGGLPTLDQAEVEKLLEMYPLYSHSSTPEVLAALLQKDHVLNIAKKVYNHDTPFNVESVLGEVNSEEEAYKQFTAVANKMDEAAKELKSMRFSSLDDAQLILCQMIRSFVPNLCAHFKVTTKGKLGPLTTFVCGSVRYPKDPHDACKWKAKVREVKENGKIVYMFTEIDSFTKHNLFCLKCHTRFTSVEVSFQSDVLPEVRAMLMTNMNQCMVREGTYTVRRFRKKQLLKTRIDSSVKDRVSKQTIDPQVTDLDLSNFSLDSSQEDSDELQRAKTMLPNEPKWILQYLSMIKEEDGAYAKACFVKELGFDTLQSIHLMWPSGFDLLSKFGDVIFCDSMWNASNNGEYLLTIVVIDNENKLRLAAASVAYQENEETWKSFFSWVKTTIPAFNPKCIVTDGASYIPKAFEESIGRAVHLTCWWHQREASKRKKGERKFLHQKVLAIVYAENAEELKQKVDDLTKKIKDANLEPNDQQELLKFVEKNVENALIKLRVFTGGTLTNSYAESINNRLRRFCLSYCCQSRDIISLLRNFCMYQVRPERDTFVPRPITKQLMDDAVLVKVSKGVLATQQKMLKQVDTCEITSVKTEMLQRVIKVTETKRIALDTGYIFEKKTPWTVTWHSAEKEVHCTCNALTYKGMPCVHIACAAKANGLKIPLSCFNPRFYKEPVILSGDQHQQNPEDASHLNPQPERSTYQQLDADTQHITDAWLNSFYNDPDCIEVRGHAQALDTMFLKLLALGESKKKVIGLIHKFGKIVENALAKSARKNARNGTIRNGMVPHARKRIRANSYKTVPLAVRKQRAKALALQKLSTKYNKNKKRVVSKKKNGSKNKKRCESKHKTPTSDE